MGEFLPHWEAKGTGQNAELAPIQGCSHLTELHKLLTMLFLPWLLRQTASETSGEGSWKMPNLWSGSRSTVVGKWKDKRLNPLCTKKLGGADLAFMLPP